MTISTADGRIEPENQREPDNRSEALMAQTIEQLPEHTRATTV